MKKYLMGYIAASEYTGPGGGEFILEKDDFPILFKTREKAAAAAVKHGYKYTRGYVYETSDAHNARGMKPLDEVSDTGVVLV
jgi:hypothetical protein